MKPPFEAYSGDEPFVFVCYAHEDTASVYPEIVWLRDQGLNIWYDEGISPGEEWPERVAWAIGKATQVLFYVTPKSVQSRVCRDEVNLALAEKKPVVTVFLKPTELAGGLKLSLSTSQAIVKDRYRTLDDFREQVKESLFGSGILTTKPQTKFIRHPVFVAISAIVLLLGISSAYLEYNLGNENNGNTSGPVSESAQTSIAVLPLRDMSPSRNLEYLGEGVAEELIHGLAQVQNISVMARTSSFYFKNQDLDIQSIGQRLGVDTVLEGSIQLADDRLRVTLQLINVGDGFHIWSKQYDGSLDDIFTLQDEIAKDIVSAVIPNVDLSTYGDLTNVGTNNPLAYDAFLVAEYERTQQTRDSIDRAIEQFKLAIRHDPKFVRAYERLIDAYDFKGFYYGEREEMLALAEQVLEEAKENDLQGSNTYWFWMEQLVLNGTRVPAHFGEGERLYSSMITDASHPANGGYGNSGLYRYSLLLAKSGLFDAAIQIMTSLEARDPMNIDIKLRLAEFYGAVYDFDSALAKYADLLEISPRYVQAHLDMFLIYGNLGLINEAESIKNALAQVFSPDLTELLGTFILYWKDEKDEALAILNNLADSREIPANYKGISYLAFGEIEKAFIFLDLAATQNDPYASELFVTQSRIMTREEWLDLQENSEFISFMERYGYDESWPAELTIRANRITEYTGVVVNEIDN